MQIDQERMLLVQAPTARLPGFCLVKEVWKEEEEITLAMGSSLPLKGPRKVSGAVGTLLGAPGSCFICAVSDTSASPSWAVGCPSLPPTRIRWGPTR